MMTIKNSLLNEKYNYVIESICEMLLPMKSKRPTCEQLLKNKSLWALSVTDIQNDSIFEKFMIQGMAPLMAPFFTRFIKLKLKNLKLDFGNPEISSETFIEPKMLPKTPVKPKMNERTGRVSELTENFEKSLSLRNDKKLSNE